MRGVGGAAVAAGGMTPYFSLAILPGAGGLASSSTGLGSPMAPTLTQSAGPSVVLRKIVPGRATRPSQCTIIAWLLIS